MPGPPVDKTLRLSYPWYLTDVIATFHHRGLYTINIDMIFLVTK